MTNSSITSNDVLCGRGGATNNHIGNKRFRSIVADYQHEYLEARKKDKAVIARKIVQQVKENGGRFLKRDPTSDVWVEVPFKKATEKTSQALREGLDVRHKTIRPEKMIRRDDGTNDESPRKRARLVEGKVVEPSSTVPPVKTLDGVPELTEEHPLQHAALGDPLMFYFAPPPIYHIQPECNDTAQV